MLRADLVTHISVLMNHTMCVQLDEGKTSFQRESVEWLFARISTEFRWLMQVLWVTLQALENFEGEA